MGRHLLDSAVARGVKKLAPASLFLLLVACGGGAHQAKLAQPSPPATTSASAAQTVAQVSPTTSATATPPAGPHCKIPLAVDQTGSGFITLPGGSFSPDANSNLAFDNATNTFRTQASPVLHGPNFSGALSYDAALNRWLPVLATSVAPNGTQYAYAQNIFPPGSQGPVVPTGSAIHIVDIPSGRDRVVYRGPLLAVVGWKREGVYLTHPCFEGCGQAGGLWLLDPTTGLIQQIIALPAANPERVWALVWSALGGGAAWAIGADPNNPDAQPDRLVRHDLNGGPETIWFAKPGTQMTLLGMDGAQPVVAAQTDAVTEVWLVTGSNQGQLLSSTPAAQSDGLLHPTSMLSDSNGIWIGSTTGVFLWANGVALEKLSSQRGSPAGNCT